MTEVEPPSAESYDRRPVDPGSEELLSRFARGDDSALGRLVEKEGQRLLPFIQREMPEYLRRRVGASDILQNAAIDLLKVRHRFENRGVPAFRGLLRVMAKLSLARAVERERAKKRDVVRDRGDGHAAHSGDPGPAAQVPADQTTPSGVMRNQEETELLAQNFRSLSEEDRQIIELIDYLELSHDECASLLEISVAASRKRHTRAVARLREQMRRRE